MREHTHTQLSLVPRGDLIYISESFCLFLSLSHFSYIGLYNDSVASSFGLGSSLCHLGVVNEHSVPESAVRDIASCHFVLVGVHVALRCGSVLRLGLIASLRVGALSIGNWHGLSIPWRPLVRRVVEVLEQEVEHHRVHSNPPDERLGIVAIDEEQLEGVHQYGHELGHLQDCQVFLPPEVRLDPWPECRQQVVRVHDDVHKCVQHAEEGTVTA